MCAAARPQAVVSTRLPVVLPEFSLLCRLCRKLDKEVVLPDTPSELSKLLKLLSRPDKLESEEDELSELLSSELSLEIRLFRSASRPPPGGGRRPEVV